MEPVTIGQPKGRLLSFSYKYHANLEVTDNDKRTSFLWYETNYNRKVLLYRPQAHKGSTLLLKVHLLTLYIDFKKGKKTFKNLFGLESI